MAKVYGLPEGVDVPSFDDYLLDGRYNMERHGKVDAEFLDHLRTRVTDMGFTGELAGEVVRFSVADGYACYMILSVKPAKLMHLPLGDAWTVPDAHERGLTSKDLVVLVEQRRAMESLFGGSAVAR